MVDGKPTAQQISEVSDRHILIEYKGVPLLFRKSAFLTAVTLTAEWTHDPTVEKLAQEMGIKLRRFR